jgi:hypothetical protein
MISHLYHAVAIGLLSLSLTALAQEKESEEEADPGREKRFQFLDNQADKLKFAFTTGDEAELTRGKEPILRWSNPHRGFTNDGLVYVYFEKDRPQMVMGNYIRGERTTADRGELMWEFTSFCDKPLACSRGGSTLWRPTAGAVVNKEIPNGPAFAERPVQRLAQMRDIAARFEATNHDRIKESPHQLRLLTRPHARYEAKEAGIVDGTLFSFVEANDPEVFLRIEAVAGTDKQKSRWQYSLARMTTLKINVKLDGIEVYDVDFFHNTPMAPTDPYTERIDGRVTIKVDEPPSE